MATGVVNGKRQASKKAVLIVRLSILALLLATAGLVYLGLQQAHRYDSFKPHMSAYTQRYDPGQARQDRTAGDVSPLKKISNVPGPVVVVDPTKRSVVAGVQSSLTGDLRAASPNSVKLVVWLDRYQLTVGHYQDGTPALQWFANLTFLDPSRGQVVGSAQISGDPPPDSIARGSTNTSNSGGNISDKSVAKRIAEWATAAPTG